jgi:hypothetical protein
VTIYIIAAQLESFKAYWTGDEWSPSRSQAKKFDTRTDANVDRCRNIEIEKPITPKFIEVQHL